jgi:hypothetical protein
MKAFHALLFATLLVPAFLTAPADAWGDGTSCGVRGSPSPVGAACEAEAPSDLFVTTPCSSGETCLPPARACFEPAVPGPEQSLASDEPGVELPTVEEVGPVDASTSTANGCCRQTHVSQAGATTQWTYPSGAGATGFNQPSVAVSHSGWTSIAGAQPIWKDTQQQATNPPFGLPVVFAREFITCSTVSSSVNMRVNADDAFQVYFNNNLVYTCNSGCWTSVHVIPTQAALAYPNVNTWSWRVHNTGGPTMLQYSYTF